MVLDLCLAMAKPPCKSKLANVGSDTELPWLRTIASLRQNLHVGQCYISIIFNTITNYVLRIQLEGLIHALSSSYKLGLLKCKFSYIDHDINQVWNVLSLTIITFDLSLFLKSVPSTIPLNMGKKHKAPLFLFFPFLFSSYILIIEKYSNSRCMRSPLASGSLRFSCVYILHGLPARKYDLNVYSLFSFFLSFFNI